jgi:hypothetical protein
MPPALRVGRHQVRTTFSVARIPDNVRHCYSIGGHLIAVRCELPDGPRAVGGVEFVDHPSGGSFPVIFKHFGIRGWRVVISDAELKAIRLAGRR